MIGSYIRDSLKCCTDRFIGYGVPKDELENDLKYKIDYKYQS